MSGIKKGDIVIYPFGFGMQEAKVIKEYGDGYIKVRHNSLPFPIRYLDYRHIIRADRVIKASGPGRVAEILGRRRNK